MKIGSMILDLTPVSQDPGLGQLHLDLESQNQDQEHPDQGLEVVQGLESPRVHQGPDQDLRLQPGQSLVLYLQQNQVHDQGVGRNPEVNQSQEADQNQTQEVDPGQNLKVDLNQNPEVDLNQSHEADLNQDLPKIILILKVEVEVLLRKGN